MDFSKPDKYLKEVIEFLRDVTIANDLNFQKTFKTISGNEA